MKTYSKSDLIKDVAAQAGFNQTSVKEVLDAALALIEAKTDTGDKVALSGFGVFKTSTIKARIGRNPATGESMQIPASTRLTFKASKKKD